MMNSITVNAPAKINTILRVIGRRPNGFHDLKMIMVPLKLADEITLTKISSGIEFACDCMADAGMTGEQNLAWRAANLLRQVASREDGVKITLKKNIPVAAGLGGGSSDAAAVLRGLNQLWDLGYTANELASQGMKLGSDVPFFCYDSVARVEGLGDEVIPLDSFPKLFILLINPGFAVSTPWVYQEFDRQQDSQLTQPGSCASFPQLFEQFSEVSKALQNDLEAVTIAAHPEILAIKAWLCENGAAGALMSGSGPTVFGLFASADKLAAARAQVSNKQWKVFATESLGVT